MRRWLLWWKNFKKISRVSMEREIPRESRHAEKQNGYYTNLVFPYWKKDFHVHVDVTSIVLNMVLTQTCEGSINHPISFAIKKLLTAEKNCTTKKWEDLPMVYALHKFIHYLLGGHFKMYTDHSALKYLVNKLVLGGGISVGGFSSSRNLILK